MGRGSWPGGRARAGIDGTQIVGALPQRPQWNGATGRHLRRLVRIGPERRCRAPVHFAASILFLLCTLGIAPAVAAKSAGSFLTDLTDRAAAQLTEPGLAEAEKKLRFRSLLMEAFDLPEIGRFVLGRYWRRADSAQRSDFLDAFEAVMLHRLGPLLSKYSGEKLEIGATRLNKSNPEFITVKSKLRRTKGEPIHVDWRIRKYDGGYKIVDIVAEGVSVAVSLRSEYVSVLKRNGGDVDALTRVLHEKAKGR